MKKKRVSFWPKYLWVILLVILGSLYFGFRQLSPASVNQVSYGSPSESSSPSCYAQNVSYTSYRESCSNTEPSYYFLDYRCGYEKEIHTIGESGICQYGSSLLDGARYYCRQNLCPSASPIPSPVFSAKPSPRPSSTPVASCRPRPACLDSRPACNIPETDDMCPPTPSPSVFSGVSCRPNVYQLKTTDLDLSGDLKRYMTADRVVDISSHRVKPGDRYIYQMGLDNYSGQVLTGTLTTSTQNVHGSAEPIKVLKTFTGCAVGSDPKTITCDPYQLPKLPTGGTFATNTGLLLQITPEVYKTINTSTLFNYTIDRVKAIPSQLTGSCGILMLAEPLPKPSPRCIKWGSRQFCW